MSQRILSLILMVVALAPGPASADPRGRVQYSVTTLEGQDCSKDSAVRRGDFVRILLSAAADTYQESLESKGAAEQKFVVGRHRIPPINKGVVGMCPGEVRKVRIIFEESKERTSDPVDYIVKLLDIDSMRARLKDAL